jgi:hypothetical protein
MRTNTIASNRLKNKVYNVFKRHCKEHGFILKNSSELSLLVPAGMCIGKQELLEMVEKFLEGFECIIVVEPVTKFSDCLLRAGYKQYHDDLPPFHVHVVVKEEKYEVRQLKEKWFELVGKSKKRLFHCEPIRKGILEFLNYITKFFEDKYDANPIYNFLIKKVEQPKEEVEICHDEPVTILSRIKKTAKSLFQKSKVSRFLYKFFICAMLLITPTMIKANSCIKKNYLISLHNNSPPIISIK